MNEDQIRTSVAEDLRRIRLGPDTDIQHELRVIFNSRRKHDLVEGHTRKETITYCIDFVRRMYPGWRPNVDTVYFDL